MEKKHSFIKKYNLFHVLQALQLNSKNCKLRKKATFYRIDEPGQIYFQLPKYDYDGTSKKKKTFAKKKKNLASRKKYQSF